MQLEMRIRGRFVTLEDPECLRRVTEGDISPRDGGRVVQRRVKRVDERQRTGEQRIRRPSVPGQECDLRQTDPARDLIGTFPDADRRAEILGRANGVASR